MKCVAGALPEANQTDIHLGKHVGNVSKSIAEMPRYLRGTSSEHIRTGETTKR